MPGYPTCWLICLTESKELLRDQRLVVDQSVLPQEEYFAVCTMEMTRDFVLNCVNEVRIAWARHKLPETVQIEQVSPLIRQLATPLRTD